ncbi:PaaI family thioesterase [Henriciella sp. AS95]|uniref:PaaI family thioesterase n=1 Tax=Henriciella sp. AS95 TaxID=3135782 RepID=UPI00317E314B
MTQTVEVKAGEFTGWRTWPTEPFEYETVGPFYFRIDEQGPVAAFRAQRKHMNAGGVVHGGCLMAFADYSLFAIAHEQIQDEYGLTVAFNSEFLSGPAEGAYIEARGEVLRAGRSIIFVRGLITGDGKPCLNFSGTIMRRSVRKDQ